MKNQKQIEKRIKYWLNGIAIWQNHRGMEKAVKKSGRWLAYYYQKYPKLYEKVYKEVTNNL